MIEIAIGLGMVLSLIFTETLGVTAGGIIVPGYIALYFTDPMRIFATFSISLITLMIVRLFSKFMLIYGKRRLVFCLLLSFTLGSFIRDIPAYFITYKPGGDFFLSNLILYMNTSLYDFNSFLASYSGEMIYIGWLIPGLISSWMDRQGVLSTISTILIISSLINLILMVLGKYV